MICSTLLCYTTNAGLLYKVCYIALYSRHCAGNHTHNSGFHICYACQSQITLLCIVFRYLCICIVLCYTLLLLIHTILQTAIMLQGQQQYSMIGDRLDFLHSAVPQVAITRSSSVDSGCHRAFKLSYR